MHFRDSPFDDVTKVLIIDVVVLAADGTLCTLFQLVLAIAMEGEAYNNETRG